MDESQFWKIIDNAWQSSPKLQKFQKAVLETLKSPDAKDEFDERFGDGDPFIPGERTFIKEIEKQLDELSAEDLAKFDRILERKQYDIDREDVHENTDGSDDGFLYCRGFIVAMGKKYYDAVNADPSKAMFDWECEAMCYLSWHLYNKKFGELAHSGISRETGSNTKGWSD